VALAGLYALLSLYRENLAYTHRTQLPALRCIRCLRLKQRRKNIYRQRRGEAGSYTATHALARYLPTAINSLALLPALLCMGYEGSEEV